MKRITWFNDKDEGVLQDRLKSQAHYTDLFFRGFPWLTYAWQAMALKTSFMSRASKYVSTQREISVTSVSVVRPQHLSPSVRRGLGCASV